MTDFEAHPVGTAAEIERLKSALAPFAHPDFRLRLGGNSPTEGGNAIVFQRNSGYLRLRDFDMAHAALSGGQSND